MTIESLIKDEYTGTPLKRALAFLMEERKAGKKIVGYYCCYAPLELIWALNAAPSVLCTTSHKTIAEAEKVLPSSICPLIKSSYGFIKLDTCPFFTLSDVVIGETTCDSKKKMYELIQDIKPMHVMEIPQMPDEKEALVHWEAEVRKLGIFLENNLEGRLTEENLEQAIKEANRRRELVIKIFEYAQNSPPLIHLAEINEILPLALISKEKNTTALLNEVIDRLEERKKNQKFIARASSPRVMMLGCPVAGDAEKVFRVIEDVGAVMVVQESCSGIKPFLDNVEENSGDPLSALARYYFRLPCSVMTPNRRRYEVIDKLIGEFKPDAAIEIILTGCHTYNIESYKVEKHITGNHGIPYLKIESDYSPGGTEQLRTRIEALLEMAKS